jgi:glycosyltransferase involved in cell wall biosynthesis
MRIAGIIGVKDEADLIVPCIERLRAVGVDPIVVLDDHSTDGTAELVDRLAADPASGLTRILREEDPDVAMGRTGPVLGPLIERYAPDWILFTDADECWGTAEGRLDTALRRAESDALMVERFNVPLTVPPFAPTGGMDADPFLDAPIIVRKQTLTRSLMDADPDQPWVMHSIMPRVICRTARFGCFALGGHGATDVDGAVITPAPTDHVAIVHVPFTTGDRFANKVANARAFLTRWAAHYQGEAAWHWRRWIDADDAGRLDLEFQRERMSPARVRALTEAGVVGTARARLAPREDRPI